MDALQSCVSIFAEFITSLFDWYTLRPCGVVFVAVNEHQTSIPVTSKFSEKDT